MMAKIQQKTVSRKEKRKEARKEKKLKKYLYFSKKYGHLKTENVSPPTDMIKPQKKPPKSRTNIKKPKELSANDVRKLQLQEANEEEDKSIKRLEKILKLNKRKTKNIPKAFAADGLDYILELIDRPEDSQLGDFDMNVADDDMGDDLLRALGQDSISEQADKNPDQEFNEFSSDDGLGEGFFDDNITPHETINPSVPLKKQSKSAVIGTDSNKNSRKVLEKSEDVASDEFTDEVESDFQESDNDQVNMSSDSEVESERLPIKHKRKLSKNNVELQRKTVRWADQDESTNNAAASDGSDQINLGEEDFEPEIPTEERFSEQKGSNWEDIYGRLRDKDGNVVDTSNEVKTPEKYVPPAKRLKATTEDAKKREIQLRIHKHMRGLLNKLNESNMKHICDQIENMYMQYSRNDMNEALAHLVQQSVVLPYLTPEKLIMEHALLISVLHCNIGSEVGAYCLQCIASALDAKLSPEGTYGEGKEVDNLLLLLCHLYTFKITHSLLIYDIVKRLTETFHDKDVELILLILRSVGFVLRRDDPIELKTVIFSLQSKAAAASHLVDQSRIRFMLDTMMAIRNNNMHKIPNYDPSLAEHLRKALKSFQRKGKYVQELHISLEDLLRAEERGRWWIVGSAWQGVHGQALPLSEQDSDKSLIEVTPKFSDEVLDLARKQRMNTEVRKNIFCIIMSAEDYMDAFEKLLRLGLKNQQDREFIHVAFDCCLQEKQFNSFYAYLAEKFCTFDRKYQMALQFALWDKLKDLTKMKTSQVTNLAHFLVHLFTRNALPMSVLKVIQLAEMDKVLVKFLRQILLAILLDDSEEVCRTVFMRIAPSPKLKVMREGLRLFMMHFLLRNQNQLEGKVAILLQDRVNIAIEILSSSSEKKSR